MKIGIIIWGLYGEGGAQKQALYLAKELVKLGEKVTVYTVFYNPDNFYKKILKNIKVKFLFQCDNPDFENKIVFSNDFIRKNRILNFLFLTFMSDKLYKDLAKIIDPDTEILNPHDKCYKVSHYFNKYNKDTLSVWMANDTPSLRWNTERFEQKKSILGKLYRHLIDLYEKKFIKKQNQIIVLDSLNKMALKKYFGVDSKIIRSGVDVNYFVSNLGHSKTLNLNNSVKILMLGILSPYRRFEDGIIATKYLREFGYNITLDIIGNYETNKEYKNKLDSIIRGNNLEKVVHFLGRISENELLKSYLSHDIFVFPNHFQTWGLVVFEAMACGLPVIVSTTTGASEVLTSGENALLVQPKNSEAIAEKVKMLIDNPSLYSKINSNAVSFVKNNISWQKYSTEMLQVFESLTKND